MNDVRAVECFAFWSHEPGIVSNVINAVTGGEYSHVGIGFTLNDGRRVYYEALWDEGWQGPKLMQNLEEWAQRKPSRRKRVAYLEWLLPIDCEMIRERCEAMRGAAGYGKFQLVLHWWFELVAHRWGYRMPNTPRRVTCGEGVGRNSYPQVDLRSKRHDHWDSLNPQSILLRYQVLEIINRKGSP